MIAQDMLTAAYDMTLPFGIYLITLVMCNLGAKGTI